MFKFLRKLFMPRPFNEGYLPEKDGHKVYFAEFGNRNGVPVICFHGGPGSGSRPRHTKQFDLKKYRVILFDQRGCGKSLPAGEMRHNEAANSVEDGKRILDYVGVEGKVIVRGASWGSTLALLFAEKYPELVEKLIVTQIFLANERDILWQENTSGLFYPDMLEKVRNGAEGHKNIAKYYADLINSDNLLDQVKAVELYGSYENVLGALNPTLEVREIDADCINGAKIFINYAAKKMTLKDNEILNSVEKIAGIPTLIVHNRLDMVCPLQNAYELHKAMPASKLVIVPYMGHYGKDLSKVIRQEIKDFLKQ